MALLKTKYFAEVFEPEKCRIINMYCYNAEGLKLDTDTSWVVQGIFFKTKLFNDIINQLHLLLKFTLTFKGKPYIGNLRYVLQQLLHSRDIPHYLCTNTCLTTVTNTKTITL